jgi:hypothetical protein
MVLEFRSFCHIGVFIFVRTVYCQLAINTFYVTSVAINYLLEKFWYRGVRTSLAKRETVIMGSFAGRIRKTHSKWNHVLLTSVTINYLTEKFWNRGVQTSLAERQTIIEGSFAGRMRKTHSKWNVLCTSVSINYVLENSDTGASKFLWQSDKPSLEGYFAGRMRKTHSKCYTYPPEILYHFYGLNMI